MNAPPEFDPDYPQTNGGGVALDAANPKHIAITYAMRDPDTASGSPANQYKIWPSFEYSLNNGNSWQTIDAGYLEDGDLESADGGKLCASGGNNHQRSGIYRAAY